MLGIIQDTDLLEFTGKQQSQHLQTLDMLADKIHQAFDSPVTDHASTLPWSKTHNIVQLRDKELSLWCGVNGSGKSMLLNMVMLWQRDPVVIISPEMPVEKQAVRIIRQAGGTGAPTREYRDRIIKRLESKMYFYTATGVVPGDKILSVCAYAAVKLGAKHIVIDSLMMVELGRTKDEQEAGEIMFLRALSSVAKDYGLHIHLVEHLRKGDNIEGMPSKWDIRGNGRKADIADNIYLVHRNRKKERIMHDPAKKDIHRDYEGQYDCALVVDKQRYGEWEGTIALWFTQDNLQYTGDQGKRMQWPYLPQPVSHD